MVVPVSPLVCCVWRWLSVLPQNLLYSALAPSHNSYPAGRPGNITSEIEKEGRREILDTLLAPSFSKLYCDTSMVASASWSPLKTKKQALPLSRGVKEINNLKAQEKQDAPSLGAPCSQSHRKWAKLVLDSCCYYYWSLDPFASSSQETHPTQTLAEAGSKYQCKPSLPSKAKTPPSFTAHHSCSQNHSLTWLFVYSCFVKISIFSRTKLHKKRTLVKKQSLAQDNLTQGGRGRKEGIHPPHGKSSKAELQVHKSSATHR